jgi:hypothetical protein
MPEPVRYQAMRRANGGEPVTRQGVRAMVQHFADMGEMPAIQVPLSRMIAQERKQLSAPSRQSAEDATRRKEEAAIRAEMKVNSQRVNVVMDVIESVSVCQKRICDNYGCA